MAGTAIEGMSTPGGDGIIRRLEGIETYVKQLGQSLMGAAAHAISRIIAPDDFDESAASFDPGPGGAVWTTVATATLTVPPDFSRGIVTANAYAGIVNTTPSTGTTFQVRAVIAGVGGSIGNADSQPGTWNTANAAHSAHVEGLAEGDAVTVLAQVVTGADFSAHASNSARISGVVLWIK